MSEIVNEFYDMNDIEYKDKKISIDIEKLRELIEIPEAEDIKSTNKSTLNIDELKKIVRIEENNLKEHSPINLSDVINLSKSDIKSVLDNNEKQKELINQHNLRIYKELLYPSYFNSNQ